MLQKKTLMRLIITTRNTRKNMPTFRNMENLGTL